MSTPEEVAARPPAVRTYKYRLKDRSARKTLIRHAYAVNQVWNWCAAQQRDVDARYRAGAKPRGWASHFSLSQLCNGVGAQLGIHQQTVGEVCRFFAQSRDKHRHAPAFRSSFGARRARGWIPFRAEARQVRGSGITYLGKCYRFFEGRRPLPESAKGGAFVEDALGRWWVVFHVVVAISDNAALGGVGIDLGLKALATTSDGEVIDNRRHVARYAERLAIAQRAGSKRRVRAIHAKIAACRRDHHHKISTRLAREYAFIAVGNVSPKRLAKTRMAKSVLDAGWSSFRAMLAYKAAQYAEVDERFTTQACSACRAIPASSPKGMGALGIRAWDCSECGASHDRDVNAARNILRLGRSVAPPVEGSRERAA